MPLVRLDQLQQFAAIDLRLDPGAIGGPVVIPQCAQIMISWELSNGRTGTNVLTGRYAGTFNGSVAQANAIRTALTTGATWTALAAFLATTVRIAFVKIRDLNVPNAAVISSDLGAVFGTSVGTALPDEVAAVLTMRTGSTGPQNRGRAFIPGWASNSVGTGGVIATGAVTALQNWGTSNLLASLSANSYTPVIGQQARQAYTGSTGTQHPARAAGSVAITSCTVRDNHWDTMRRRGLK